MRVVFALLRRSHILLLFLLLETGALFWLVRERSYQRSIASERLLHYSGIMLGSLSEWRSYFHLKEENRALAEQNARLQNQLKQFHIYRGGEDKVVAVNSLAIQRYRSLPARVINSSYFKRNNYLRLDRGRSSGVEENMGVIGPQGVIGVVTQVSKHFATVLPLINPNLSISGQLEKSGHYGSVQWGGSDYRRIFLSDIPRYAELDSGDLVSTDGRSLAFPAGIPIGRVLKSELQADQNFSRIELRLAEDFSRLSQVYVLRDYFRKELDSLMLDRP